MNRTTTKGENDMTTNAIEKKDTTTKAVARPLSAPEYEGGE